MKITSGHKLLAAALLAGASQVSFAAETNTTPYMGIMGTYLFPDQDRGLDDGFGGTLLFGFPVNSYFVPEINLYGLRADRNYANGYDKMFGGGVNFNVFPFTRDVAVAPFISIGGGAENDRTLAIGNKTSGVAHAGGGFLIALNNSRTAALRVEAGRYAIFNDDYNPARNHILDTRISAGVQIALGGRAAPVPVPVEAPPPAPVAAPAPPPPPPVVAAPVGPKDSDNDGVLDGNDQCPDTPRGMKVDAKGCAIKAASIVLRDITFETNKAVLTTEAKASLDKVVAGLKGQPSMNLQIDGHTDSTASNAYNLKLSKERAASAKKYLVDSGIDASRLQSQGFGETKPVASNKTAAGRAENRRVEFKVLK
ncbi:OmpA family protein [Stenotrophobium rhamnosiphilum]|nr:OmpA family protein [Stenotrophobium rhamnosiphilum]